MTPEQCAAIVDHLPVIKACAEGKLVYFACFRHDGKFLGYRSTDRINLGALAAGFYTTKPRYQCMRPGEKPEPIAYPAQRAATKQLRDRAR